MPVIISIPQSESSTAQFIHLITLVYIGGPVMVVGVVLSLLTLFLFWYDSHTFISTRFTLSAIAIVDVGYLAFMFAFWTVRRAFPSDHPTTIALTHPTTYAILFYGANVFELYRNWLLLVMTIERFVFFYKPVKFKIIWNLTRVRIIVICVGLASMFLRIPVIIYVVASKNEPEDCEVAKIAKMTHILTDMLALTSLPLILMLFFSFLTTKTVMQVMHSDFSDLEKEIAIVNARTSARILKILRTTLSVFIITSAPAIPATFLNVYLVFKDINGTRLNVASAALNSVANLASVVSSSSNFFVYIFQSRRYRGIFKKCLQGRSCRLGQSALSSGGGLDFH
ncbi:unnamed protein product [Mesocestoides corti]|uniref:G-protein coupled receptors family 1 profile domain-containing protein n=2 Tax=Mesocestoides corti TaxID=53468 RepID=A0A0R3U4L2_MESCO|nr:unnamed protein product [Mesocestoides corti]